MQKNLEDLKKMDGQLSFNLRMMQPQSLPSPLLLRSPHTKVPLKKSGVCLQVTAAVIHRQKDPAKKQFSHTKVPLK